MLREDVFRYVREQYGVEPDFPWNDTPDAAVLRHMGNRKWFALVMSVKCRYVGVDREGSMDVLNLKADPLAVDMLVSEGKAKPAYHMNKKLWMTILLDGSAEESLVCGFIDESYQLTKAVKK